MVFFIFFVFDAFSDFLDVFSFHFFFLPLFSCVSFSCFFLVSFCLRFFSFPSLCFKVLYIREGQR